ncbi:Starch-binding associating with outer membrane [Mucilaginibacter mallensis]|uniref:Starch-binding associating with outer membrane n=1 Tax=Mucilaginibacter mallensis TaxID=652787 RepID=A0A1H1XXN6_MUCMA|nr:RagB/SusD family nutrient uptake outer membrane protein [Mucilaginibacter mallensis]SDT14038.1 Starch-binding associating with outer membrane [Mucilaginibacter mallensis]
MKKYTIILLAGLILASSCKKNLLNLTPYTAVSSSTMWTNDNLTDLGMAGVYQALRLGQNTGGDSQEEPYMMDQLGFSTQARNLTNLLNGASTSSDGIYADFWKNLYEGIQRANDAITNIPLKSPSVAAKKARYVAEAKFLRAYFYMKLNQLYKGVPIYLTYTEPSQATKPRSTELEVWNQVVADLTDAINEPNLPAIYKAGDANYGHATKGAAYALRGKAYLYTQQYALAAADFQQVQNAGYALFPSYYTLFKQANEQSSEMIFAIQNIAVVGNGGTMQFFCGNRSSYGSCWDDYLVPPNEVDLYQNLDGSTFNWDDVIPGYNELTPAQREVYFLRDNLTATEIAAASARGAEMSLYLPVGNEARIAQAYANRDPRLALSVITPYSTYNGVFGAANATVTWRWPYRAAAALNGDLQTDMTGTPVYLHRKFVAEGNAEIPATGGRNAQPINFPLIRYADVLLMWAEALNEEGQTDAAVPLVNLVRARAGVALLNSNAATTVNGQADLRLRIRNERRVEFINEGINYYDELRWGTIYNQVYANNNGIKKPWGSIISPFTWQFGSSTTYVWPIPLAELQRNPNLKQTPGYGW